MQMVMRPHLHTIRNDTRKQFIASFTSISYRHNRTAVFCWSLERFTNSEERGHVCVVHPLRWRVELHRSLVTSPSDPKRSRPESSTKLVSERQQYGQPNASHPHGRLLRHYLQADNSRSLPILLRFTMRYYLIINDITIASVKRNKLWPPWLSFKAPTISLTSQWFTRKSADVFTCYRMILSYPQ
jgi:hypothetical protein